jgi:hypothetical protein
VVVVDSGYYGGRLIATFTHPVASLRQISPFALEIIIAVRSV